MTLGAFPDLARREEPGAVRARLLGKPAIALRGPAAVGFFYDENHVHRRSALPGPVLSTLFGKGAVHTLDGETHRHRKGLFVSLLKDASGVSALAEHVTQEWEHSRKAWAAPSPLTLFDEVSVLRTRAVCRWAGIPLPEHPDDEVRHTARDLVGCLSAALGDQLVPSGFTAHGPGSKV
ncbi:cytochrome P450 family protein [Streptomyces halobius]|uniref:hypothetical protein n=1 Tax=Streptomyces halobius TaxID=2879846 RepID=UPI003872C7CE